MTRLVLSVLLCAWLVSPAPSRAWCRMTTDETKLPDGVCNTRGVPLAWKRRCFTYALDRRGSASMPIRDIREAIDRAFTHWEGLQCGARPLGFDFRESKGLASCRESEYDALPGDGNMNTIAFIDNPDAHMIDQRAFAVTVTWHAPDTGEIYDADILVNELNGPYGICPISGCTDGLTVDLENIITHEVGHFLGLGHSADESATMYYASAPGEIEKRSIGEDDVLGLCAAYPEGSLPEECSYTPRHGRDLSCEHEALLRCEMSASPASPGVPLACAMLALASIARRRRVRR